MIFFSKRPGVGRFWLGAAETLRELLREAGVGERCQVQLALVAPGVVAVYHHWLRVERGDGSDFVDAVRLLEQAEAKREADRRVTQTLSAPAPGEIEKRAAIARQVRKGPRLIQGGRR